MNPQFASHNICGLSVDPNSLKQFIPKSGDPKYISLKSILRDIDIVSFVETKLKSENFKFERFFHSDLNYDQFTIRAQVNQTEF